MLQLTSTLTPSLELRWRSRFANLPMDPSKGATNESACASDITKPRRSNGRNQLLRASMGGTYVARRLSCFSMSNDTPFIVTRRFSLQLIITVASLNNAENSSTFSRGQKILQKLNQQSLLRRNHALYSHKRTTKPGPHPGLSGPSTLVNLISPSGKESAAAGRALLLLSDECSESKHGCFGQGQPNDSSQTQPPLCRRKITLA